MRKLKSLSKLMILSAVIVLGAVIFGVYNLMWFRYVRTSFDPFTTTLDALGVEKDIVDGQPNMCIYPSSKEKGSHYSYTVAKPSYLKFEGNFSALTPSVVDFVDGKQIFISECQLSLRYWPQDASYLLSIADLTVSDGMYINSHSKYVDRNGQPLGPHPKESEGSYESWLELYEKFNEPIMEMFDSIKELFGEDAFK